MENPAVRFRSIKKSKPAFELLLCSLLLLAACGTGNTESDTHTTVNSEETAIENSVDFFPEITSYYKKQDPEFDPAGYVLAGEQVDSGIVERPYDEEQLKTYRPLLVYNSDSTRALDMYSNSFVPVTKNGVTHFESGEPDTEVALIDFKNKTRKRIFYTGPSYMVQEVRWLNDSVVAIAGALQVNTGQVKPQINKIFLNESRQEIYEFSDTVNAQLNDYHERRIREKMGGR